MINSSCLHNNLKSTQKSCWTLLTSSKLTCHWIFLSLILSSVITGPPHLYTPFFGQLPVSRIVDGKCTTCMDINFAVKFIHLCVNFLERNIIQVNRHGKCAMKEIFIPHGYLLVRPILLALFIYIYSDLFRFRWFSMFCVCCVCSLGC